MRVLLPEPGGPVTPATKQRPVYENSSRKYAVAAGISFSTHVSKRATERKSPERILSSIWGSSAGSLGQDRSIVGPKGYISRGSAGQSPCAVLRLFLPRS